MHESRNKNSQCVVRLLCVRPPCGGGNSDRARIGLTSICLRFLSRQRDKPMAGCCVTICAERPRGDDVRLRPAQRGGHEKFQDAVFRISPVLQAISHSRPNWMGRRNHKAHSGTLNSSGCCNM